MGEAHAMTKIVCIGWGSLIWNPRNLPIQGSWSDDGPLLPIEFGRQSHDGRITLVIVPNRPLVQTYWCFLNSGDTDRAVAALAKRERTSEKDIGQWPFKCEPDNGFYSLIEKWAVDYQFDSVIWTALPPQFDNQCPRFPSVQEVCSYLKSLQGNKKDIAEEYIRKAPKQIRTEYRDRIEENLNWHPFDSI